MTITYSIDHALTTTESVNVEVAEKSAMTLVRTTDDGQGGSESTYVLSSGDPTYPATVIFRSTLNKRGAGATSRRISCTFATWAHSSDSVTGAEVLLPISSQISFIVPTNVQVELADLNNLLGNVFSFMFPSVAAGVRSTTWLSKLLFGVAQVS